LSNHWKFTRTGLEAQKGEVIAVFDENSDAVSFGLALQLMVNDSSFGTQLTDILCACSYSAFRWETPAITQNNAGQSFRFVLLDAPYLCTEADRLPFNRHFSEAGNQDVLAFSNLGGDAELIVPCPGKNNQDYAHFAEFVRHAPDRQKQQLWIEIGKAATARVGPEPIWINTAGDGVAWLHIRVDTRPKYYRYRPYKTVH